MAALGALLAFAAAIANSGATLLQARAASRLRSGLGFTHADNRSALRTYTAGLTVDLVGWLLTVAALRFLPIFAVQSIVAEQVAITVLLGGWIARRRTRVRDGLAAGATVTGLIVIAAAGVGTTPTAASPVTLLLILAATVGTGGALSWLLGRRWRWLGVTVLAGTCFSASSVVARGIHGETPQAGGLLAAVHLVLVSPAVWLMLLLGGIGTVLYARAIAAGRPGPTLAVLSVTEVLLPGTTGLILLGDTIRPGWALPCASALLITLTGTAILVSAPHRVRWCPARARLSTPEASASATPSTTPDSPRATGGSSEAVRREDDGHVPRR